MVIVSASWGVSYEMSDLILSPFYLLLWDLHRDHAMIYLHCELRYDGNDFGGVFLMLFRRPNELGGNEDER
jgi:hypothetical protein